MAEPVTPRSWRKRSGGSTHTRETVTRELPPDVMDALKQCLGACNDLARRVGILESVIATAGRHLDEIDKRRGAR